MKSGIWGEYDNFVCARAHTLPEEWFCLNTTFLAIMDYTGILRTDGVYKRESKLPFRFLKRSNVKSFSLRTGSRLRGAQQIYPSARSAEATNMPHRPSIIREREACSQAIRAFKWLLKKNSRGEANSNLTSPLPPLFTPATQARKINLR